MNSSLNGDQFAGSDSSDALAAQHASSGGTPSFLRPMTATGQTYTPSYTAFQNAPTQSYTHPLYNLFNDRRTSAPTSAPSALVKPKQPTGGM